MRALHQSLAGAQARPGWARLGYPFPSLPFPSPRGKARVVDSYFYYYYLSPALFPTINSQGKAQLLPVILGPGDARAAVFRLSASLKLHHSLLLKARVRESV